MIQRVCNSIAWFPRFLKLLKSIVSFLRDVEAMKDLQRMLKREGKRETAEVLKKTAISSFAKWRFFTLHLVCKALDKFILSLSESLNPKPFRAKRDGTQLRSVCEAFGSKKWYHYLWLRTSV